MQVQLVVLPPVRAKRLAMNLMRHLKNPALVKKALHELSEAVKDPFLAESFAEESGLDILKTMLQGSDLSSNALAYALKALVAIVGTRAGLIRSSHMARELMSLLYRYLSTERGSNPSIYTSAAGALLSVCGAAGKDGTEMLSEAAREADDPQFVQLVHLVADSNIPTATQSLLLIGCLLSSTRAPDRAPLLERLKASGLDEALEAQKNIRDVGFHRARNQFLSVAQEVMTLALVRRDPRPVEPIRKLVHELNLQPLRTESLSPLSSPKTSPSGSRQSSSASSPALPSPGSRQGSPGRPSAPASPKPERPRSGSRLALNSISRGACDSPDCGCLSYVMAEGSGGGPCKQCGHFPARHKQEGSSFAATLDFLDLSKQRASPLPPPKLGRSSSSTFLPVGSCRLISRDQLEFTEELGVGSSATVYRGLWNGFQEVAIKVLTGKNVNASEFVQEMSTMAMFDLSENIVTLYGVVMQGQVSLVMEFCERGSLYHVLMQNGLQLGWDRGLRLMLDASHGLQLLHSRNIVHRDVKSLNFLVTQDWRCKISDLGLARTANPEQEGLATQSGARGTILYCAPEVFQGMHYERSFDVYSFGIVLWEVLNRLVTGQYQRPYQEFANELRFDFQIVIQVTQNNLRPTIPGQSPDVLAALVEECWNRDSNERPDMPEVCDVLQECVEDATADMAAFLADTHVASMASESARERRMTAREERRMLGESKRRSHHDMEFEMEVEVEVEDPILEKEVEEEVEVEVEVEEGSGRIERSPREVKPAGRSSSPRGLPKELPPRARGSPLPKEMLTEPMRESSEGKILKRTNSMTPVMAHSPRPLPKETLAGSPRNSPGRSPSGLHGKDIMTALASSAPQLVKLEAPQPSPAAPSPSNKSNLLTPSTGATPHTRKSPSPSPRGEGGKVLVRHPRQNLLNQMAATALTSPREETLSSTSSLRGDSATIADGSMASTSGTEEDEEEEAEVITPRLVISTHK